MDIIEKKILQWCGQVKMMPEERIPKLIMDGHHRKEGKEDVQDKRG